jgi:hypothetical protein
MALGARAVIIMSVARSLGLAFLGLLLGGGAGALLGLLGGLGYTSLAATASFEGYSAYVTIFWMLCGIVIGAIAGAAIGLRRSMR